MARDQRPPRRRRADGERSRRAILEAAAQLATTEGLEGLSIGHLADHIGISKSGLYSHFGSKEELQLATVETAREIFDADVVQPAESLPDPLARLQALCERFISHVERRVFAGGCFFASVGAEFDTHPGPVKERVAELQGEWQARLETLIQEAQAAGDLDGAEDPASWRSRSMPSSCSATPGSSWKAIRRRCNEPVSPSTSVSVERAVAPTRATEDFVFGQ